MLESEIIHRIIAWKDADIAFRDTLIRDGLLGDGYHRGMAAIHNENAMNLAKIIDKIGYPTIKKVGREAYAAAWLIIQHAIEQPDFMKRCAALLQLEVERNEADPMHLAYLLDRINVMEGKPQLYGTQYDWDKNGELNPNLLDDIHKVNDRRASLGLNSIDEQTHLLRSQALKENHAPPSDYNERQKVYDAWRRKVGWIK